MLVNRRRIEKNIKFCLGKASDDEPNKNNLCHKIVPTPNTNFQLKQMPYWIHFWGKEALFYNKKN